MTVLNIARKNEDDPIEKTDRLCFPPKNRILNPRDYQQVFKRGRRQRGTFLSFVFCASHLPYPRLGLAIAKRNIPLSVKRNQIRRLIRESFRHSQQILGGIDIIVLTQKSLKEVNTALLREELDQRWFGIAALLNKSC